MSRWPIERSWHVVTSKGARLVVPTHELRRWPACVLLGAAGLGKTFEQAYLADLERADGFEIIADRMAVLAQTADGLTMRLNALGATATPNTAFFLDALDEVMVPVRPAGLIVQRWISDVLQPIRPHLRLSCRSAVWPPGVKAAIEAVYGVDGCAVAVLQPLTEEDVLSVASTSGLDSKKFLRAVDVAGVRVLSEQPLTLKMLLKIHAEHGALPGRRRELFRDGMQQLANERRERFRDGTAVSVPTSIILEAAERVACFCVLSGRDTIDLGESPASTSLAARHLENLPGGDRPLDATILEAVGRSGLCEGDGVDSFRFAHRQFAEYLAGRRIASLLPHQARALLGAGTGWQSGVAGPLRETAAFAAIESAEIAAWISRHDPEVMGLSDVADASLRRLATLNLLEKFRRHELTDSQTGRDGIELAGFQYAGAQEDLRAVLRERQDGCQDVLECAIELIESWELSTMSGDLADVMLDATAPTDSRRSAGYALRKVGTSDARRRLLPLLALGRNEAEFDLKGLALRCNWPDNLSVPELFDVLTALPPPNYSGAYGWFLHELDSDDFDARGHSLRGLRWASNIIRRGCEHTAMINLVRRVAIGALDELGNPGVSVALADLLLDAAEVHTHSPLQRPHNFRTHGDGPTPKPPVLATMRLDVRRCLIEALAARATRTRDIWFAASYTPGLLLVEDFPWIIERAVDAALPIPQRENLAELAHMLPWRSNAAAVEAWLRARETEPIASRMSYPLTMELGSDDARKAREQYDEMNRSDRPQEREQFRPLPHERVEQVLALSETKDPRFFLNLCQELTLEEDGTDSGFCRFLSVSPGWAAADGALRARIVESAKRFLDAPSDEPERILKCPLNRIPIGYMAAIWLVLAHEPAWINCRPTQWWQTWAWYIMRESRPDMSGEPKEPKRYLLGRLHARAPEAVRQHLLFLARSHEPETQNVLDTLLGEFLKIDDVLLDQQLCEGLEQGGVPDDRVSVVASFVLTRNNERALAACMSLLVPDQVVSREKSVVRAAVALLRERTQEAWLRVFDLMKRRRDLAQKILSDFAHGQRHNPRNAETGEPDWFDGLNFGQVGQLIAQLMECFPPESDQRYGAMGPDDLARRMRDGLISRLSHQKDYEAVEALRILERTYGVKYPWLRRPRARAERAFRLSSWTPVSPVVVAEILAAQTKRLLRSNDDVLDGVVAALEEYQQRLKHHSPSELDDLWNQPTGAKPTPKNEELVSDKVCVAVRNYFRHFALTANREVQVFRRKLARSRGGAPGSEVDVLCDVPPVGTSADVSIQTPIEVKLAHNREARTGMQEQLVGRYMSELGTDTGVYVVVWMGSTRATGKWNSPNDVRGEIERQASEIMQASSEPIDIRCVVIDASLPRAVKRAKPVKGKKRAGSQPGKRRAASRTAPGKRRSASSRSTPTTSSESRSKGRRKKK